MRVLNKTKMVPLSVFTPELILTAPQVNADIADNFVRQAAIDFVEASHCLKRDVIVETQAGVEDMLLTPGDGTRIDRIDQVCDFRGNYYSVLPERPCYVPCGLTCATVCGPFGSWARWGGQSWLPTSSLVVWFEQPNVLHVRPVPVCDIELGMTVKASVVPNRDACELDELLYQKYQMKIVAGALAYLFEMPDKPWTNLALAAAKRKEAYFGSAKALGDSMTGARQGVHKMTTARFV